MKPAILRLWYSFSARNQAILATPAHAALPVAGQGDVVEEAHAKRRLAAKFFVRCGSHVLRAWGVERKTGEPGSSPVGRGRAF